LLYVVQYNVLMDEHHELLKQKTNR
jgi:hypothetical protein